VSEEDAKHTHTQNQWDILFFITFSPLVLILPAAMVIMGVAASAI
jgi:hypothetical protein